MDEATASQLVRYTRALLVLQLQGLGDNEGGTKPEVLLARSGLNAREIGDLLGKNQGAVAKTLQRAGKSAG